MAGPTKLTHKKGDHFKGHNFALVEEDGVTPTNMTGAILNMWFRLNGPKGPISAQFSIGNGLAWINQALGQFRITKQIINWQAGDHYSDIEVKFDDGDDTIETVGDLILKVTQDVTQPTYA